MASGDFTIFNDLPNNIGLEKHKLDTDVIKLGIVDSTKTPLATDVDQDWSDFSANEVVFTGGYTENGLIITSQVWEEVSAKIWKFDAANFLLAVNGSGFTDGYWGILYNSTETATLCLGFVDLGGPVSEQAGAIQINWNASGIFRISVI